MYCQFEKEPNRDGNGNGVVGWGNVGKLCDPRYFPFLPSFSVNSATSPPRPGSQDKNQIHHRWASVLGSRFRIGAMVASATAADKESELDIDADLVDLYTLNACDPQKSVACWSVQPPAALW